MKYVNTTASLYKSVTLSPNNEILSYDAPFSVIQSEKKQSGISIGNFVVITQIDLIGTNKAEAHRENPLVQRAKLDFIIRLTKCDKEKSNRLGFDLDAFTIDLNEMEQKRLIHKACFDFFNYTQITNVGGISLPKGTGKYVIKVLVKEHEKDDKSYTIQSMTHLMIA